MHASEALAAKERGIRDTADKWIGNIQKNWEATLSGGRDTMWVEKLDREVQGVQDLVVKHFQDLGYSFRMEADKGYYCDEWHYRIRLKPLPAPPSEEGIFKQFFKRLFGG